MSKHEMWPKMTLNYHVFDLGPLARLGHFRKKSGLETYLLQYRKSGFGDFRITVQSVNMVKGTKSAFHTSLSEQKRFFPVF